MILVQREKSVWRSNNEDAPWSQRCPYSFYRAPSIRFGGWRYLLVSVLAADVLNDVPHEDYIKLRVTDGQISRVSKEQIVAREAEFDPCLCATAEICPNSHITEFLQALHVEPHTAAYRKNASVKESKLADRGYQEMINFVPLASSMSLFKVMQRGIVQLIPPTEVRNSPSIGVIKIWETINVTSG
jgi:hypothetical protein